MTKRRTKGSGSLTLKGKLWHMRYIDPKGKRVSQSTGETKKSEAQTALTERLAEISEGRYQTPDQQKLKFEHLVELLNDHYYSKKSGSHIKYRLRHLQGFFGGHLAMDINYRSASRYITKRRNAGAAEGTIYLEVALLRQALRLAMKAEEIQRVPTLPFDTLEVDNVRTGYFTDAEFEALKTHLPDQHKGWAEFAFWTGWRAKSEIFPLEWSQVDFKRGVITLHPGTTKNRKGRSFPFDVFPQLAAVLERQRAYTDEVERKTKQIIPYVFHRNGSRIKDPDRPWITACKRAGFTRPKLDTDGNEVRDAKDRPLMVHTKNPHDFRRTAVRRLEQRGVPRSTAKKLVGHKTDTMYERYAITNEDDLREGVRKIAGVHDGSEHNVLPFAVGHT